MVNKVHFVVQVIVRCSHSRPWLICRLLKKVGYPKSLLKTVNVYNVQHHAVFYQAPLTDLEMQSDNVKILLLPKINCRDVDSQPLNWNVNAFKNYCCFRGMLFVSFSLQDIKHLLIKPWDQATAVGNHD